MASIALRGIWESWVISVVVTKVILLMTGKIDRKYKTGVFGRFLCLVL